MATPAVAQNRIEARADSASLRAYGAESTHRFMASERRRVHLLPMSTVSAIEAVARGEAEFALTARGPHPLKTDENELDFHPIAWDALVLITHPGNPTPMLSLRQLRDIYLGKITRWDEVGGPPRAINLYAVAGPLDGVEYSLRRILFGAGHRPVAATRWYLNTEQLEAAIVIDPSGLGVSLLSNVLKNPRLRTIPIEGIAPLPSTIRSGEYLLSIPLYFVRRRDPSPSELAMRYVRFLEGPTAANWLKERGLVPIREAKPLTESFAARERALLNLLAKPAQPKPGAAITLPLVEPAPDATPPAKGDRG